jgi:DNA polymerase III delta subunit
MQIVWNQEIAEQLKNSHTVLELETFSVNGQNLTAYCVIPPEKIVLELAELDANKQLHTGFLQALNEKNYTLCQDIAEHLLGRFGGELDSFYQEILSRIKPT